MQQQSNSYKIINLDLKNYPMNLPIEKRKAIRGIVQKADLFLLIQSKYGDFKFPGGGQELGEDDYTTVIRETKEETGYEVIKIHQLQVVVLETRAGLDNNILKMDSFYYKCDVSVHSESLNLDDYEREYGFKPIWVTLKTAIDHNYRQMANNKSPWLIRETKVMEYLVNH